jgi:hypothetical protein
MVGDVLGNILGRKVQKDSHSYNMAITPEKFKKKYEKFQSFKHPTGEKFTNIVDELDQEQLGQINRAFEQHRQANVVLKPYGLDIGTKRDSWMRDSWVDWRTSEVAYQRGRGTKVEKNPRQ